MSQQQIGRHTGWTRRGVLSAAAVSGTGALLGGGVTACSSGTSGDSNQKVKEKIKNPPDNLKKKGFPIVKEPVTLHFMTGKGPINASDYNKVASWKRYQDMTNIKIDWGLVPVDDVDKKRNLALGSDDYPEAFHNARIDPRDAGKYGSQGVLIKLNDLIDQYMPNLKKVMDDHEQIGHGMTFPGGEIYTLPELYDPDWTERALQQKLWVRGDWLDKFDMDVPKTTGEYYKFLKKVKTRQPNGKGESIGYCDHAEAGGIYESLSGSFGVMNRGGTQSYIDAEPDDDSKVRFFPISDGYKALLEYLHKLYSEGLIAKNIFSIDQSKVLEPPPRAPTAASTRHLLPSLSAERQKRWFRSRL